MATKSVEAQLSEAKVDLRLLASKLDAVRSGANTTESKNDALASRVANLEKELAKVTDDYEKLSASSAAEISVLGREVKDRDGFLERALEAEAQASAESARADTAEALVFTNQVKADSQIAGLRQEVKDLQTKVFVFREAVKGL